MNRLRQLCLNSKRLSDIDYVAFLKEIGAIEIHELEDYFLYMYDNNIKVSNADNSIVAYLINITDEKPTGSISYKGGTIPDIDTDFSPDGIESVYKYIQSTYGHERVSNIGTYGVLYARSAIRATGRALGMQQSDVDTIAKLVPDNKQGVNWYIRDAIETNKDFKDLLKSNKMFILANGNSININDFIRYAERLEGVINNRSIHAAGVIISNDSLYDIAPTWRKGDQRILEFNGSEAENLGLVKVDLLALKTLSIMQMTIDIINKRHNINLSVDDIPLEDKRVFKLLSTGNLLGVFQLAAKDISRITASIKPTKFSDVVLILAGYRPGPMEFVFSIDAKRNNRKPEIIPHSVRFPILEDVLKETYG